ncbi:hypothetical protein AB0I30_25150 [Nocardia tengchongensis]|uniref:hypothetical protein n=1 Tax=Nocardia tengchongensis TaxID=2055889 RepID=UPI0033C6B92C
MIAAPHPRRDGLSRLLVVLAALLGMLLLQNAHCTAGMAMGMPMTPDMPMTVGLTGDSAGQPAGPSTDRLDSHGTDASSAFVAEAPGAVTTDTAADTPALRDHPQASGPGIGMACLAMFLALLSLLALRYLHAPRPWIRTSLPTPAHRLIAALPRPLSLAELCVLRT